MAEPEVALVFTPEAWVEELHRHLTDHGGGRVRQVVVEPEVALEESYDVLVASYRWAAMTHAFVAEVHARGRAVLGVFDREEPAARAHLQAVGVDHVIESDRGPKAFVDALAELRARRYAHAPDEPSHNAAARCGRIVVVGGPRGSGRTEIALQLAPALGAVLVDADDVAPSVGPRLALEIEPNLRTAIEAVEHGRGAVTDSLRQVVNDGTSVVVGLPNASAWAQVRPGEVVRVIDRVAAESALVVVDGAGSLEDFGVPGRERHAVARALVLEADVLVGVCAATPVGIARFLSWVVEARRLAPTVRMAIAVNRAPGARFRRGEIYEEIARSIPACEIVFVAEDQRVTEAMWDGRFVRTGPFTRAVDRLGELVRALPCVEVEIDDYSVGVAS
jgi:hypothetical protein